MVTPRSGLWALFRPVCLWHGVGGTGRELPLAGAPTAGGDWEPLGAAFSQLPPRQRVLHLNYTSRGFAALLCSRKAVGPRGRLFGTAASLEFTVMLWGPGVGLGFASVHVLGRRSRNGTFG